MRASLSAAFMVLGLATPGAQTGAVTGLQLSAGVVDVGTPVRFTVTGRNPCGAVEVVFGDGDAITYPITGLPHTVTHTYKRPGSFAVTARGQGPCQGRVAATPRVIQVRPLPAPGAGGTEGLLDRNRDGVISRAEWRAADAAFESYDWNRDGILSGDEVRAAQGDATRRRRDGDDASRALEESTAVDRRFARLDRNRDARVTRDEWDGTRDAFERLDRDGDWVLTRDEMTAPPSAPPRQAEGGIVIQVSAERVWTDTGLIVEAGDRITFDAQGTVRLSANGDDTAGPRGARSGRLAPGAPMPAIPAGTLIARIDDGPVAAVGNPRASLRVPRDGRLYLGVNDDHAADNRGAFRVSVFIARR